MQMLFEKDGKTIKLSPQNLSEKCRVYEWGIVIDNDMPRADVGQDVSCPAAAIGALKSITQPNA
jgi:hypothetical protein